MYMEKEVELLPGIMKLLMDVGELRKEIEKLRTEITMLKAIKVVGTEKSTWIEHRKVVVTTEPTLILEVNEKRLDAVVKNLGPNKIYCGGTPSVSIDEGFELEIGGALKLEDYRGELWAVSEGESNIRVIELIK